MTAPAVSIQRLSATAHIEEGRPEDATRIARLLRQVAAERLDRALRDAPLPPGIWCVRTLDVAVQLDLDRPDPALEASWSAALVGALRHALQSGSREVVRYDHEHHALVDLVCGAVTGHPGRAWAWRRLGLLHPADPPLEAAPGAAAVAALHRHPQQALGVIVAAAERVGLPALHRALGPSGWTALAGVVRSALGGGRTAPVRTAPTSGGPGGDQGVAGAAAALAAALVAASRLADQVRRSRVRPDRDSLDALALLVVAESDPSALRRAVGEALVAAAATTLGALGHPAPPPGRAPGIASRPGRRDGVEGDGGNGATAATAGLRPPAGEREPAPSPAAAGEAAPWPAAAGEAASPAAGPAGPHPPDGAAGRPPSRLLRPSPAAGPGRPGGADPPVPAGAWAAADPQGAAAGPGVAVDAGTVAERDRQGRWTEWAGLLFLLATAAEAGVPDTVVDDPVFAARPLPWILQGIGMRLVPVTVRDAALAAFAGADPDGPPPWESGPPAGDDELARLEVVARRWAAVTAAALGASDGVPLDLVASIARRTGMVDHTPGWLEIHLDLEQVDVAVRRAGLDLDPGWVPWLGTVVRFVYE